MAFTYAERKVIKIGRTGRPPKTEADIELDKQIGKRFRLVRETMKKTQAEMAEHYHKSEQAVRDWEAGRSSIPIEVLQNLSDSLEIDLEFLQCKYDTPDLQITLQKWNKEVPRIQSELHLLEYCNDLGIETTEDNFASRTKRIKNTVTYIFSERGTDLKTRSEIKVIIGSEENRIIENFGTGEITIQAVSEEDVEKGFQQLIRRGIIAE